MVKVTPGYFFLCDGLKECRKSTTCHINGGECKHTTSYKHALYKDSKSTTFDAIPYNCTKTCYCDSIQLY